MDALITPEARRELAAWAVFRPRPGAWGVLVGHMRGPRFIVEKAFPAGSAGEAPGTGLLAGLEGVWPDRTIGLFVYRPGAVFLKAVRGPAWYGKLVLRLAGPSRAPVLRPSVVDHRRGFGLTPVELAPAAKEGPR